MPLSPGSSVLGLAPGWWLIEGLGWWRSFWRCFQLCHLKHPQVPHRGGRELHPGAGPLWELASVAWWCYLALLIPIHEKGQSTMREHRQKSGLPKMSTPCSPELLNMLPYRTKRHCRWN